MLAAAIGVLVPMLPRWLPVVPRAGRALDGVYRALRSVAPSAARHLERRVAPALAMHLVLALAASVLLLVLFASLTHEVQVGRRLAALDRALATCRHLYAGNRELAVWTSITMLGSAPAVVGIAVMVTVALVRARQRLQAAVWAATVAGAALLNVVLKLVFERPRPPYPSVPIWRNTWSFPSGHAMASLVLIGMLAYLVFPRARSRRTRLSLLLSAIALVWAIGFSRLLLGVHYLSDILAGYVAGTLWLGLAIMALEVAQRPARKPN